MAMRRDGEFMSDPSSHDAIRRVGQESSELGQSEHPVSVGSLPHALARPTSRAIPIESITLTNCWLGRRAGPPSAGMRRPPAGGSRNPVRGRSVRSRTSDGTDRASDLRLRRIAATSVLIPYLRIPAACPCCSWKGAFPFGLRSRGYISTRCAW